MDSVRDASGVLPPGLIQKRPVWKAKNGRFDGEPLLQVLVANVKGKIHDSKCILDMIMKEFSPLKKN
jgi:hypothetical protein